MRRHSEITLIVAVVLLQFGCGADPQSARETPPEALPDGQAYLLDTEPQGASNVIEARETAADDEQIVVVGRIGGSEDPWVEGRAAFSIVDLSLEACSDKEGDMCRTPWDYCCETDLLPKATVLVKIVDDSGELVAADARDLLALEELQTVVASGKAKRDEAGNLSVLASAVYVRP